MRPYMRLQYRFEREIDTSLSRDVVISELQNYCSPNMGKVVVPVSDTTGCILGIAYLNYLSQADGARRAARLLRMSLRAAWPMRGPHAGCMARAGCMAHAGGTAHTSSVGA